jgi:large subunit ribosomal protein L21
VLFVFAVVKIGGKQYKVQEGDIIFVEKLDFGEGEDVEFADVLAFSDNDKFVVGDPTIEGASVGANVIKHGKDKKIYVMTYKSKKNQKKKMGHRQPHTKIQIKTITAQL